MSAASSISAAPEIFTRKASGLVRVMSPYSAFVYNILTMGLIFPWTYLWAPGALPGGNLFWGIILATIIEIPIAFAYVWLSTALPRSGGDYVFQSRVFAAGARRQFGAPRVAVVDPTGAGDMFAAAFLIFYQRTRDPWSAARFAIELASVSVTRAGLLGVPAAGEIAAAEAVARAG